MDKRKKASRVDQWTAFDAMLQAAVPHLHAVFSRESDFIEIRVKARDDGTCLTIVKAYSADGAPMVVFGSGYGVAAALMGVDGSIQGGRWRPDRPWKPGEGEGPG